MNFSMDNNEVTSKPMRMHLLRFALLFPIAAATALLMHQTWIKNLDVYHTILELVCVFIAFTIFISVWYTCDKALGSSYILGFGYLTVAIFDSFHIYYHLKLDLTAATYFDLSTRFWILGRLAEAAAILLALIVPKPFKSKYLNLTISLAVIFGIVYLAIVRHNLFPLLLTSQGVTPVKVFLEYVVIGIYLVGLYCLRDKLGKKGSVTYKYIFMSLLMSISAEFCFTIYNSVTSISWTLGHIFKIISYFYLFRGVFVSTVVYPYEELKRKNSKFEEVNQNLNLANATLGDLLDTLPVGILKFDREGRLKYANHKFMELAENENIDMESLAKMEYDSVYKLLGSRREQFKRLTVTSQKITNGMVIMLNETKKEQELQNLHIQTETILNAINNGALMIDENKRIVLFNNVFEHIYEIDKEEIIGMSIDQLNEMTDFAAKELPDKVIFEHLTGQVLEVPVTSFKGNKKILNLYVSPIKNIEGKIIGAISIGTDATEQKKEQQQMLQQEKLALLGQMGASIVHETRNYLTTIKGRCQLIELQSQDENIRLHSAKISRDVEEVNRIISEFLFLSKPREANLLELGIHDVFESIKSMIETSSLVKGVNIEYLLCRDERYVLCDEAQLKQVILNICKNAIDAMIDQPNAKLIIETGYSEVTDEAYIKISDNGKGISKENLEKIGSPFFTTKSNGTGLGLSVCFKIIKEHGGRIDVTSELGQGTQFTIVLPCVKDEEFNEVI